MVVSTGMYHGTNWRFSALCKMKSGMPATTSARPPHSKPRPVAGRCSIVGGASLMNGLPSRQPS